jgi:Protein of unknown function (DUF3618)
MAQDYGYRSAEIEREVDAQRAQVESTFDELRQRLKPSQLVDEVMNYTRQNGAQLASNLGHGSADFAQNLGRTVAANPLPAALLGISLAWLMAGPKLGIGDGADKRRSEFEPEYGTIRGDGMRRVSHGRDDSSGLWYSEFADEDGTHYRAQADKAGKRMGHFMDDTGKNFAGFFNDTGKRITEFRDEAGDRLEDALGWADHTWSDVSRGASQRFGAISDSAKRMGGDVQQNAARLSRDAMHMLEEQPLVMGALAFAAGAAVGAVVPHTRQEDELLGEAADDVKLKAGEIASDLYEQGKEKAGELYEDISDKAGEVYGDAKRRLAGSEQDIGIGEDTTRH